MVKVFYDIAPGACCGKYHIAFGTNFYSVPYTLTGEVADFDATPGDIGFVIRSAMQEGRRVLR
jgi:hypothetical protein